MRNLRTQLFLSHLLLAALMALAMLVAVVSLVRLGSSIDRILRNNYDSVVAAQNMKEFLERQDSATTFFLAGETDRARRQYQANWPQFQQAYGVEANNITEPGEQEMANAIGRDFATYRSDTERLLYARPPWPRDRANIYYFSVLEPEFRGIKQGAQDVLNLNQQAIVRADSRARAEAQRATLSSLIATAVTFVLAMLLARQAVWSALTPLVSLTRQTEEIGAGRLNQRIETRRTDEIGTLAAAFNDMAQKLTVARQALEDRLQRAERMSDAALEHLYDPVVVTDAAGAVVHLNRAAEGLFGPEAHAVGRPVSDVVPQTRIVQAVERAVRHERTSAEEGEGAVITMTGDVTVRGVLTDGAEQGPRRAYRMRVTPMLPGGEEPGQQPLGAVVVLEDVTYLRELDRMKTEFIGIASHELKTPVASLLLSTQLLAEGAAGTLSNDQTSIVRMQLEDLGRLDRLLRDLLDVTRLEAGARPPRPEIVSPGDLIAAAADAVRQEARRKGVQLDVGSAAGVPPIRADRGQFTRLLVNLLSNAVRHTPAGGRVRVDASTAASDNGQDVAFVVSDTGEGIAPEHLPHLFERFWQAPGKTGGGAGLGLSIAGTIAKAHGGRIDVVSEPGHGSMFTVTLPGQ